MCHPRADGVNGKPEAMLLGARQLAQDGYASFVVHCLPNITGVVHCIQSKEVQPRTERLQLPMDERHGAVESSIKKRRRACDSCRRKKVRCDGIDPGQSACAYCLASKGKCTFDIAPRKWPPSKAYVSGLEARIEQLERRLASAPGPSTVSLPEAPPETPSEDSESDTDHYVFERRGFEDLRFVDNNDAEVQRYFVGRSSQFLPIMELEQLSINGPGSGSHFRIRPEFRMAIPGTVDDVDISAFRIEWPPPDLVELLINAYFEKCNQFFPLLHRPTFISQWVDPANHRDRAWVSLVFGIFAVASKYVDDRRVLAYPEEKYRHSAGVSYWRQMRIVGYPVFAAPTLQRLQVLALSALFILGSVTTPTSGWAILGNTMRLMQDAGMHRKSLKRAKMNPFDYEMRKRVFWITYFMDKLMTSILDRPVCMREEDYDVEMPLELDDNALEELKHGREVSGYSNRLAAFNSRIRLLQIASRALESIYVTRNQIHPRSVEWERGILVDLSSDLNSCLETLPECLRYDPNIPDPDILLDSTIVHLLYQYVQMLVHRPFLAPSKRQRHPDVPALEICSNAARTIARAVDNMNRRSLLPSRFLETALPTLCAGTVLVKDMWERKDESNMDDIRKCGDVLKMFESNWQIAGSMHDILRGFAGFTCSILRAADTSYQKASESAEYPPGYPVVNPISMQSPLPQEFDPDALQNLLAQMFGAVDGQSSPNEPWPFMGDPYLDAQFPQWLPSTFDGSQQQNIPTVAQSMLQTMT